MRHARKEEKVQFLTWLGLPEDVRHPKTQKELAEKLGVAEMTLSNWRREYEGRNQPKALTIEEEVDAFKKHLYDEAMKPKASAKVMELYAIMQGLKVEKREEKLTIDLGADELFRVRQEARRKLSGETAVPRLSSGNRSVFAESAILSDKVCVDTKQEHREDSQVGTVGSPSEVTR